MLSPTTYLGTLMLAGAAGLTAATRTSPDEQAIRRHIERYYFEACATPTPRRRTGPLIRSPSCTPFAMGSWPSAAFRIG